MVKLVTWNVEPITRYTVVRCERDDGGKDGSFTYLGEYHTADTAQRVSEMYQREETEKAMKAPT